MRLWLRVLVVVAVFAAVGWGTAHVVIARAVARGTPEYEVRLAGAMAGLFVGGAAAVIVLLASLLGARRSARQND